MQVKHCIDPNFEFLDKPCDFWTNLVILINEENSDDDDGDHRTVALVESHGRSWVEQASSPLFSKVPDLLKDCPDSKFDPDFSPTHLPFWAQCLIFFLLHI